MNAIVASAIGRDREPRTPEDAFAAWPNVHRVHAHAHPHIHTYTTYRKKKRRRKKTEQGRGWIGTYSGTRSRKRPTAESRMKRQQGKRKIMILHSTSTEPPPIRPHPPDQARCPRTACLGVLVHGRDTTRPGLGVRGESGFARRASAVHRRGGLDAAVPTVSRARLRRMVSLASIWARNSARGVC